MARKKEYNTEDVEEQAMRLFWEKGYETVGMRALEEACGISSRTMYDVYPSKNSLYAAALERYGDTILSPLSMELEATPGIKALRGLIKKLADIGPSECGCLATDTLSIFSRVGGESQASVGRHLMRLTIGIKHCFSEIKREGSLQVSPALATEIFVTALAGLRVRQKAGLSRKDFIRILTGQLDMMCTSSQ